MGVLRSVGRGRPMRLLPPCFFGRPGGPGAAFRDHLGPIGPKLGLVAASPLCFNGPLMALMRAPQGSSPPIFGIWVLYVSQTTSRCPLHPRASMNHVASEGNAFMQCTSSAWPMEFTIRLKFAAVVVPRRPVASPQTSNRPQHVPYHSSMTV